MTRAAPHVKPAMTERDRKLVRKPSRRVPTVTYISPTIRDICRRAMRRSAALLGSRRLIAAQQGSQQHQDNVLMLSLLAVTLSQH